MVYPRVRRRGLELGLRARTTPAMRWRHNGLC
jgi:hypothetical protein